MAVKFICDNCGEEYDARISVKGIVVKGTQIEHDSDPCPKCEEEAAKAKEEALAKRKKKV